MAFVLSPALFLVLLELILWLTRSFEPVHLLNRVEFGGNDYWVSDAAYGKFVLQRANMPVPQDFAASVDRALSVKRVVLIGESAAAGFPQPQFNLARVVQVLWQTRFPETPIEVVNLTMVGVNSHILRRFAREAMKLQPDALVIYAGHNEVIGPYGPAALLAPFQPSPWLVQASLSVRNTRLGRALERLLDKLASLRETTRSERWRGLNEFADTYKSFDDPALEQMLDATRDNFRSIVQTCIRNDCKVLVCVPAVNLTDWPPMASEPEGERSALIAYTRAQAHAATGDMGEAWRQYRKACDLDLMRFRADSRVRQIQRDAVEEAASPNVGLVDADIWLHEENRSQLTDSDFFLEHVHLTFEGRVAVAELIVDGLAELFGKTTPTQHNAADWWKRFPDLVDSAKKQLLFTEYDESYVWDSIYPLLSMQVFQSTPGIVQRITQAKSAATAARQKAEGKWSADAVQLTYDLALQKNPKDPWVDQTAAELWSRLGEAENSTRAYARALTKAPTFWRARIPLIFDALAENNQEEADTHLQALHQTMPEHPDSWGVYAKIYDAVRESQKALQYQIRQIAEDPRNPIHLSNLAMLQEKAGKTSAAVSAYREIIKLAPKDDYALANLARLLTGSAGENPEVQREAIQFARQAAELQPTNERYREILANALKSQKSAEPAASAGR